MDRKYWLERDKVEFPEFEQWIKAADGRYYQLIPSTRARSGVFVADDDQAFDGIPGWMCPYEMVSITEVPKKRLNDFYCGQDVSRILAAKKKRLNT